MFCDSSCSLQAVMCMYMYKKQHDGGEQKYERVLSRALLSVVTFVNTFSAVKDTLCICLVYGLVWLINVLHGDGMRKLVEHPLLESLQPLVVMAAAHKLLVLQWGNRKGAA